MNKLAQSFALLVLTLAGCGSQVDSDYRGDVHPGARGSPKLNTVVPYRASRLSTAFRLP